MHEALNKLPPYQRTIYHFIEAAAAVNGVAKVHARTIASTFGLDHSRVKHSLLRLRDLQIIERVGPAEWKPLLGNRLTESNRRGASMTVGDGATSTNEQPIELDFTPPTTIGELCDRFMQHAELTYRKPSGRPTGEARNFKHALDPLREAAGDLPIASMNSGTLRRIQDRLRVKQGPRGRLTPKTVNGYIHRIRQVFRWGAEREWVPETIPAALAIVRPLRCARRQPKPVEWERVEATLPFLPRTVRAMVLCQWWTGARSGEIVILRPCDIDRSVNPWLYRPAEHKNEHWGIERVIPVGPHAQAALKPVLRGLAPDEYLFKPGEAAAEMRARRVGQRRAEGFGNRPGPQHAPKPREELTPRFLTTVYHKFVSQACDEAFPPANERLRRRVFKGGGLEATYGDYQLRLRLTAEEFDELKRWREAHRFHPHRLRHSAASRLRSEVGIEAASLILGHRNLRTTELYAAANVEKAMRLMEAHG